MSRQRKSSELRTPDRVVDAFAECLETTAGREAFGAILEFAGLYRQDVVFGDTDQSNFKAGQRSVASWIFRTMMEANPAAAAAYIQEKGNDLRGKRRCESATD
ncbi:MAG: hypothetical protein AAF225_10115 [Pseudomonadota bacterium]